MAEIHSQEDELTASRSHMVQQATWLTIRGVNRTKKTPGSVQQERVMQKKGSEE
jgi:hypothetical protein